MTDKTKLLHQLGVGLGFTGLILWYFAADQSGAIETITLLIPESHRGAGLMLAIIIVMTPAFFIWKLFNRWLEKRLSIKGRFYEDEYYKADSKKNGNT